MARIVNRRFDISGMEVVAMLKHYCVMLRMPFVDIADGPRLKYLCELAGMHYIGRLLAGLEVRWPRVYRVYVRLRNSAVFRYKRYRNLLARRLRSRY